MKRGGSMVVVLFALLAISRPLPADQYIEWSYKSLTDPFDDSIFSHAATAYSREKQFFVLGVRCVRDRLDAIFNVSSVLGSGPRPVRYRVDKRAAVSGVWEVSKRGTGVFAPDAEQFAWELIRGESVIIEVRGRKNFPYTATFVLEDAAQHIEAVLSDCNRIEPLIP